MSAVPAPTQSPIPYRAWWGLAGCALLMGLIFAFAPYSNDVPIGPDRGNFWYYWQRSDATALTRLSAWLPYAVHQLGMWYLIACGRSERPRYVFGLHWFNAAALAWNGAFIVLHILQTKVFYDGLAQDTHEATSMGSVTLMLFMILILENRRRGMFFGVRAPFMETAGEAVRRYHGYYFSWAIIYTFWYHPIEMTSGHLAGFSYMFLLLLQSSLFFTRFHINRYWTVSLEFLFCVHGALVAWTIMNKGQHGPWSMFLFGGIGVFLVTQIHGLGLSTKQKLLVAAPLIAAIIAFYSQFPQLIMGLPRMSVILIGGACLMAGTIWALCQIFNLPPKPPERVVAS